MSRTITLELDEADYERLLRDAQASGQAVEELAAQRLRPAMAAPVRVRPPIQAAVSSTPALNGPNSEWEQILQSAAQQRAMTHEETPGEYRARLHSAALGEADFTYPDYPGFEALRPEAQKVACLLAERCGGTPDHHARTWWASPAPRSLPNLEAQERQEAEERAMRWFGTVDGDGSNSADNERVDAELARHSLKELDGNEDDA